MAQNATSRDRLAGLARALDAEPPDGLLVLSDDELAALVGTIERSHEAQRREVARAEADLLHHVPRPLRGTVKRMMR